LFSKPKFPDKDATSFQVHHSAAERRREKNPFRNEVQMVLYFVGFNVKIFQLYDSVKVICAP
jgi:hypothetical protein